ncbi:ABC transporter permease [Clostridium thermopalmarium]|uniref:Lipoprotein-releasing system transmembrane protein LolE n=1 Tax=Clostridium thermopalmarium DSM 5974 TaxID=1121340 RepID=A0A2T0AZ67_9CLOT|nr:ABC transporter permease [Clostridium thermopalmarium]PRR76496.1 Lipoprotein-releasing system transmembrane protein LolE [Clostridium thermopalmarium DSM 5974]PVZ28391.1 lipoprotein-releasing system permease protein [Clostridium thermopalmarium DSM 5974]
MLTSFKIASRFLRKSKIQTLIIIMGIAIGVSVQIFIGLLSQGLDKSLLSKVAGSFVHINITSSKGSIESWEDIERKIKAVDKNINIVSPVIEHNAFINTNNKKQNIQVRGFLPQDLNTLYDMKNKIYEGKMISKSGQALIGKDLGDKLGLKIGDKINVVNFQGKNVEVIVVGFYNLGAVKLNSIWVITDLKTAQDIADSGNKITSFELSTNDAYNADNIANNIKNSIKNNDLKIENWKDQNKLIASAIIGQKICSVIIQFFVLLASVLSIMSILNISVVQKYKQIGILKAMGIKDGSAALIFLLQAFILGLVGTAVGVLLTLLYIKGFNRYIVTSDGKPIVDIIINNRFIIISSLIAVAASTLAAVFPAIKSLKLTPVEVIKNG